MDNHLVVTQAPPQLPLYAKAVLKGNRYKEGAELPALSCDWGEIVFPEDKLSAYRELCQIPAGGGVPLLFPHMLLGPVHLWFMSHPEFPLKPLGAVHSRNHIIQYAPLAAGTKYSAHLKIGGQRRRPQGLEFDLHTLVSEGEQLRWVSISTYLVRMKLLGEDEPSPLASVVQNLTDKSDFAQFEVPLDTGKRFGRLSGDINPIHMSALLAKCFGFKRDLAHGMWAAARGNAFFEHIDPKAPIRQDVSFKGPLYLGQAVAIKQDPLRAGAFEFYGGKNDRPSVVGLVRNVPADEQLRI